MQKVFQHLLAKLKSLGASIIFADAQKIIICTNKESFEPAENYINFILKSLISYPLFQYLSLSPKKYWQALLLKDEHNYCGIDNVTNQIHTDWNICIYLPPVIEQNFTAVIAKYLHSLKLFKDNFLNDREEQFMYLLT